MLMLKGIRIKNDNQGQRSTNSKKILFCSVKSFLLHGTIMHIYIYILVVSDLWQEYVTWQIWKKSEGYIDLQGNNVILTQEKK